MADPSFLTRRTTPPILVGDTVLRGEASVLAIRGTHAGLVWNRPVGILLERGTTRQRHAIVDVTRLAQVALFGLSILFVIAALRIEFGRRRTRGTQDE